MSKKLKVVGLALVAVFAVSAFSAAAAQAAPNWTVKGAALGSGVSEETNETVTVTKFGSETVAQTKLIVPEFLTITCTGLKISGGKITGPEKDSASALVFSGCKVLGPKEESTVCTVTSEKGANGTIKTTANTSQLKRNGASETYDYFTPVGETFVTIEIGSCALSGSYKVTGTAALKPEYNTNAVLLGAESSKALQEKAGAVLKFGVRNSFLQGKGDLSLKSGNTWGVTP